MNPYKYEIALQVIPRWKIDVENGKIYAREGLAQRVDGRGYSVIDTTFQGKKFRFKQHQIIAIAGGLDPRNRQINHIDGNKTNNRLCNLEIVSPAENVRHAIEMRLTPPKPYNRLFTDEQVKEIKVRYRNGETQVSISKDLGCSSETIGRIIRGYYYKESEEIE